MILFSHLRHSVRSGPVNHPVCLSNELLPLFIVSKGIQPILDTAARAVRKGFLDDRFGQHEVNKRCFVVFETEFAQALENTGDT